MVATLTSLSKNVSVSLVSAGISISFSSCPAFTLILPFVAAVVGFVVVFPASSTVVTFTSVFTYW